MDATNTVWIKVNGKWVAYDKRTTELPVSVTQVDPHEESSAFVKVREMP